TWCHVSLSPVAATVSARPIPAVAYAISRAAFSIFRRKPPTPASDFSGFPQKFANPLGVQLMNIPPFHPLPFPHRQRPLRTHLSHSARRSGRASPTHKRLE